MVQGAEKGVANPTSWIWADRQAKSIMELGCIIETFAFENRRSLVGLLKGAIALRRKTINFRADLVHVHFAAAQAVMAVLFSPKPVVISFCGSDLLGNYKSSGQKSWSGNLSILLSQIAALGARRCIAKTDELKQALWFSSCQNNCEVIPNGVNLDQFHSIPIDAARAVLGWAHNDPVVLFMDRKGAWVKDPLLAIAAFEKAKKRVPQLRMKIIEKEPPDRMPFLLNAADVLLITSRHEGSNNTVKEALACNLPVVSCSVGDIPERLKNVTSSIIVSRDSDALAEALVNILRQRSRSNGREHIVNLSLDNVAQRILKVYKKSVGFDKVI